MRTTVNLPAGLAEAAKRRAAEAGRTLTSLVEDGLRHVMTEPRHDTAARALPAYRDPGGRFLVDLADREELWATLDADRAR